MKSVTIKDLEFLEKELITLRHDLHQYPELGFAEKRTSQKIAEELKNSGLEVHTGIGKTGIVGVLHKGKKKTGIMMRADMDALPINEKSFLKHKSKKKGVMHACGHDGHITMLLGGAKYLAKKDCFDGVAYFVFQPNEENGLGAQAMLNDGLLEKFPADEIYGIHNLPGSPLGEFSTRVGDICSSESLFEIKIIGKGGHSSMPQIGVDTIIVGSELVLSLQTIISRKLPPGTDAVLSVTEFITDGIRNVLPGETVLLGDIRTRNPEVRSEIKRSVDKLCKGIAIAHNVKISVKIWTEFIETINAEEPCNIAMNVSKGMGMKTIPDRLPMSFSEDFAHFAKVRPSCFILMGNGSDGPHGQPLHSSDYDFNDKGLIIGSCFWVRLVCERLPKFN